MLTLLIYANILGVGIMQSCFSDHEAMIVDASVEIIEKLTDVVKTLRNEDNSQQTLSGKYSKYTFHT